MILTLLIKFIYMLKIHMKQNDIFLKNVKKMVLKIWMIQMLLVNIQIICETFITLLEITAQTENVMHCIW